MKYFVFFLFSWSTFLFAQQPSSGKSPLQVAIVGLSHDHVNGILHRKDQGDIKIVAIVETDQALAEKYASRYGYSMEIVYPTLEAMYEKVQPEAVTAFNSIYDRLSVVEFCAPRGIHVMVEKPLAVSVEHAEKMIKLAKNKVCMQRDIKMEIIKRLMTWM